MNLCVDFQKFMQRRILKRYSKMASEKPVNLKKHKKRRPSDSSGRVCIIHNSNLSNYGDVKPFTEIGWKKICDIKCIRLQSDNPKIKLSNICEQIPEAPNDFCHGYHRPCYQTFTSLRQTEKRKANEQEEHSPRKKRTLNSQGTTVHCFFPVICAFFARRRTSM